jgi:hypothetical protein
LNWCKRFCRPLRNHSATWPHRGRINTEAQWVRQPVLDRSSQNSEMRFPLHFRNACSRVVSACFDHSVDRKDAAKEGVSDYCASTADRGGHGRRASAQVGRRNRSELRRWSVHPSLISLGCLRALADKTGHLPALKAMKPDGDRNISLPDPRSCRLKPSCNPELSGKCHCLPRHHRKLDTVRR